MTAESLRATFGAEVRRQRAARGRSLEALADASGVAVRTLYNIEHDDEPNPQLLTVERIAEALGLPAGDLLGADSGPIAPPLRPLVRAASVLESDDLEAVTVIAQRLAGGAITMQELSAAPDFDEWSRIFDEPTRATLGEDQLRAMFNAWRREAREQDRRDSSANPHHPPNESADSEIA